MSEQSNEDLSSGREDCGDSQCPSDHSAGMLKPGTAAVLWPVSPGVGLNCF